MTMISYKKFPFMFRSDSEERQVFLPEDEENMLASPEQIKELLADAEFYADKWGPDMLPPGLKRSAKATIKHARAALAKVENA